MAGGESSAYRCANSSAMDDARVVAVVRSGLRDADPVICYVMVCSWVKERLVQGRGGRKWAGHLCWADRGRGSRRPPFTHDGEGRRHDVERRRGV